uniref:Uncharacterized protein n=1 Tax=Cacopsylla melanoneura TaxID=428564 RepID=A0A8D8UBZ1_9HEMI
MSLKLRTYLPTSQKKSYGFCNNKKILYYFKSKTTNFILSTSKNQRRPLFLMCSFLICPLQTGKQGENVPPNGVHCQRPLACHTVSPTRQGTPSFSVPAD